MGAKKAAGAFPLSFFINAIKEGRRPPF